jgi:hypothetical protein
VSLRPLQWVRTKSLCSCSACFFIWQTVFLTLVRKSRGRQSANANPLSKGARRLAIRWHGSCWRRDLSNGACAFVPPCSVVATGHLIRPLPAALLVGKGMGGVRVVFASAQTTTSSIDLDGYWPTSERPRAMVAMCRAADGRVVVTEREAQGQGTGDPAVVMMGSACDLLAFVGSDRNRERGENEMKRQEKKKKKKANWLEPIGCAVNAGSTPWKTRGKKKCWFECPRLSYFHNGITGPIICARLSYLTLLLFSLFPPCLCSRQQQKKKKKHYNPPLLK